MYTIKVLSAYYPNANAGFSSIKWIVYDENENLNYNQLLESISIIQSSVEYFYGVFDSETDEILWVNLNGTKLTI